MKLTELVDPPLPVQVEEALKAMDWEFDVDATDEVRLLKGNRALEHLKGLVIDLYEVRPELAETLWETHCPYAQPGSLLALIRR